MRSTFRALRLFAAVPVFRSVERFSRRRPFCVCGRFRRFGGPEVAPLGHQDLVPRVGRAELVVDLMDGDVHRRRELRMPQPALHLLEGLAVCEQERAACLAEGVERNALVVPDLVALRIPADAEGGAGFAESWAQDAVVDASRTSAACLSSTEQPGAAGEAFAGRIAARQLDIDADSGTHAALASVLRRLGEHDVRVVAEMDVSPRQAEELADAHAGLREQGEEARHCSGIALRIATTSLAVSCRRLRFGCRRLTMRWGH
jgi:hypothetical protein